VLAEPAGRAQHEGISTHGANMQTSHTSLPLDPLDIQARRCVALKLGWLVHAFVYLCVNTGLFLIAQSSERSGWNAAPLLGWGLGLSIHGLVVLARLTGDGWREQWVARERQRLSQRSR
jgi:hypothetical protein